MPSYNASSVGNTSVVTNIALFPGTDHVVDDQILDSSGNAVDLSDWSAVAFAVHVYGDPTSVYFAKTLGSGVQILSPPTAGMIQVTLDAADTAGMLPGEYAWYMERTDSGSDDVVSRGLFTLLIR